MNTCIVYNTRPYMQPCKLDNFKRGLAVTSDKTEQKSRTYSVCETA